MLFEALTGVFDVTVHVLHSEALLGLGASSLKLRVYDHVTDMPGYLRGLEDELAGTDLIVGIETSRLATFQAIRAARKLGVPSAVVVNEYRPYFYERYPNIRAIQYDIGEKADLFYATSRAAAANLRLDGIAEQRIRVTRPVVDFGRFQPDASGRKKFRSYVDLDEDDIVLLFHHDLEAWSRPGEFLTAMARLTERNAQRARRLKLLFVGNGAVAMELKYRSHDLGLGQSVMFLHQDPQPFLTDLYAAADVMLMPRPLKADFHEEIPLSMLEAMSAGIVPLVGVGSVAAELAADAAVVYMDDSGDAIAAAIQYLVDDPVALSRARRLAAAEARELGNPEVVQRDFALSLLGLVQEHARITGKGRVDVQRILADIARDIRNGDSDGALMRLSETELLQITCPSDQAEIWRLKGDLRYDRGELEEAMNCFSEGLKLDGRNYACLRGLGYVAWQGHANEDALAFFKKALALKGDDSESLLGIGLLYRRLGLVEEAIFWLEKCVLGEQAPQSAVIALAQTCAQARRSRTGITVLERVIDAIGEQHSLLMTLGQLYLNAGMTEEGTAILKKALGSETPAA